MSGLFGGGKKSVATTVQRYAAIQIQTSAYGGVIPLLWGTNLLSPNLIYYTDFTSTAVNEGGGSGKGGGGSANYQDYNYSATIIFALCEGVVSNFGAVYNDTEVGTMESYGFTTFDGSRPQEVWSYLSSAHPADAVAYSGTVLVCQANMALDSDASIGNFSFECTGNLAITSGPGQLDVNAADYIPSFLTDPYFGAGWAQGAIYDLTQLRNYVDAMALWQSPILTDQRQALDHLRDMLTGVNADAFVTGEGVLKILPYGDVPVVANGATYTPDTTPIYDLGVDDFIVDNPEDDPIKITRGNHDDTFNTVPIEYLDRTNQYNTNTVWSTEPVDADIYGQRTDSVKTQHGITQQAVALVLSRILAQRSVYIRNEFTFMLGWRYIAIEPMDLLTLTEPKARLNKVVCRVTKVKEDDKGRLQITAQEWPFGVAHATLYGTQSSDTTTRNPLVDPGNVYTPTIFDMPLYLTSTGGAALGVVASGGDNWGGCEVWMSADGNTYALQGRITRAGRYGVLSAAFPDAGPYDTTDTLAVDLTVSGDPTLGSITADVNADFGNLALVDNELVSFQTATLTATAKYNLTNLYRGVLGSEEAAHVAGARFVRMDDSVLEIPITPARIGTTLYFKLLSYNVFGKSMQALSDVDAYTYVPNPSWSISSASSNFTVYGSVNAIAFEWGQNLMPGSYVVELWQGATPTAFADGTAVKIWEGTATAKLWPMADTTTRYYWIRPRAADGRYGAVVPAGNGTPGAAALVTDSLVLSISPGSATSSGLATTQTTNSVTVQPTGGTAPYTYAWSWHAGGSGLSIDSSSSATTTFTATGLGLDETRSGTAQCIVTDNIGQRQTIYVSVQISETATTVSATASPTSANASGASASETTGAVTVSASGGAAPYTYAWTWESLNGEILINSSSAATTSFTAGSIAVGQTMTGTAKCTVTDSFGQTATCTVAVNISRAAAVAATASPASWTTSSSATTQTTGSSTVTATGGVSPYTYAWTWQGSSPEISIDDPSSASTSFTASGLNANGETRSGTALCTVTDHLGQTATCTVAVSITCAATAWQFTITPGSIDYNSGYESGSFGSGTGLTNNGHTIIAVLNNFNGSTFTAALSINGFSSDPGADFISQITVNGGPLSTSGASYSYSAGVATWDWANEYFSFAPGGGATNCSLTF